MKRLHFILTLLLALCVSVGQAQVSVETTSGISTEVSGSLQIALDGNWSNNGMLTAGTSTITLNGSGVQTITNASGAFNNLTINKASGDAQAAGNFTVDGTFTLTSGDVDLNGNVITLGTNALLAETAGNTVKGATGHIETTRDLNAPNADNVAGLGFEITSAANLGSTVIKRGHAGQSVNHHQSVGRYFDVTPTNNAGLNASVVYHYDDSELAGQFEPILKLYKSHDGGSSWLLQGGTADGSANTITRSGVYSFGRWTAAEGLLGGSPLAASAGADQEICAGSSAQIGGSPTASGGQAPYTYSWSPATGLDDPTLANPTASPTSTTTYTVIVTDNNDDIAQDEVVVTVNPNPVADAGADQSIAPGGSVQIGGSPTASGGTAPYTYAWSPATGLDDATIANPTASPSSTTAYTVTVTDANGCTASDEVLVTVNPKPIADAGQNQTIEPGGSVQIGGSPTASGGQAPYTYAWSPSTGLDDETIANPTASPSSTTSYTLTIIDANGCTATDEMVVTVNQPPSAGKAFVLLADKDITIQRPANSEGAIHANNDLKFKSGKKSVHTGNLTAVDDVTIEKNNTIIGDVTAGDKISNKGTVTGSVTPNANVPKETLPTIPHFRPGDDDIDVGDNDVLTLAPGDYDKVTLDEEATLILSSGTYNIAALRLARRAVLIFDITSTAVIINIADELDFSDKVKMQLTPATAMTDSVTINFADNDEIVFGEESILLGTIVAPEADITLDQDSFFKGAICAETIEVKRDVTFVSHASSTILATASASFDRDVQSLGKAGGEPETASALQSAPSEFALEQNYPNPFNPTTTISFAMPEAASVTLEIYNMLGQKVRTLVSGEMQAGYHTMQWDATNDLGQHVPSGVYLYRLQAGSVVKVMRMTLMK